MNDHLHALAQVKRILVLHDLQAPTDNVAWRGALLAAAQGGWLRIVHASRMRDPEAARERLAPLAWRLQEHLQVAVLAQAFRGSWGGELGREAADADLVALRAGSALDPLRAARIANRPTLIVRTPAAVAYRRILLALDDEADTPAVLAATRALGDGKEVPVTAPLHSAAALLERERTLFPDLVILPCGQSPSLVRRFLALSGTDTLLLPAAAGASARARPRDAGLTPAGAGPSMPMDTGMPIARERA